MKSNDWGWGGTAGRIVKCHGGDPGDLSCELEQT